MQLFETSCFSGEWVEVARRCCGQARPTSGLPCLLPVSYSKRRTSIGSTRLARRAGSQQATSAAATSLPVVFVEDGLVTDAQVRRLRDKRMSGKTLAAAAAAGGVSERTARHWQRGALPSTAKAPRTWRTREDPSADVWQSKVVPQLVADTAGRL